MISFIVITHNNEDCIGKCLSQLKSSDGVRCEIIVVDNNSTDKTKAIIKEEFPNVLLCKSDINRGYSYGINKGVANSKGDVIFIMNPDAQLLTTNLRNMYEYIKSNHVSVLGPKVINPDGTRQFSARRFPTLKTGFFNRLSLITKLLPNNKYSNYYLNPIIDDDKTQNVDWVSGCSMVIRRDIYEKLSGFDEDFFLFNEDVDFCYRSKKIDYKVQYYPYIIVMHKMGISNNYTNFKVKYQRHRSMWLYYRKHFKRNFLLDILVFCGIVIRFIFMCPSH